MPTHYHGGGGNRPGEDGPYRPPNPNETPPYPPKKIETAKGADESLWEHGHPV